MGFNIFEDFRSEVSEICVNWVVHIFFVHFVALSENSDVVASSEWVWAEEYWLKNDLRIFSGGLLSAAPVKVPVR